MAHDKCLKEASKKCDCIADTIDDLTKKNEELRAENGKLKDIEVAKCLCDIGENETGILMSEQVYKETKNRKARYDMSHFIKKCSKCGKVISQCRCLEAGLSNTKIEYTDMALKIIKLQAENKKLKEQLNEWRYQMAYFTEEDIVTPKGVKKFLDKHFLKGGN